MEGGSLVPQRSTLLDLETDRAGRGRCQNTDDDYR